jgi:hypothetical protein
MTRAELIEAMARAIREAPMRDTISSRNVIDPTIPLTEGEIIRGRAALAAIEASGFVVRPKHPTPEMQRAGALSLRDNEDWHPNDTWRAMVDAYSLGKCDE